EADQVRVLVHHRRVVDLEVARMDDESQRRANNEPARIRDAVGDREELDFEHARFDDLAALDDVRLRALKQAVFLELYADQSVSQAGAINGRAEFAHEVWQRADMVFVAVREEDGA